MSNFFIAVLIPLVFQSALIRANNITNAPNTTELIYSTAIGNGCDRLEYVDTSFSSTYLKVIPAGVCLRSIIGSEMYVCDDTNTMRELSWYSSDNCEGDVSYSESAQESLAWNDDIVNISIICCTGNPCPYVDIIVYDYDDIDDCSLANGGDDINLIESLLYPYVTDYCHYRDYESDSDFWSDESYKYQCSNGIFTEEEYDGNLKCEGTISDVSTISDGDCETGSCSSCSTGVRSQVNKVICGVAIDTCGANISGAPLHVLYVFNSVLFLILLSLIISV
mmetsp:Transcript_32010/g.28098  ORF Transcript_32010/g.28098 Transcript_32010/m.28098 type:complete len:279 (+) Transcript_32010:120-956(+)